MTEPHSDNSKKGSVGLHSTIRKLQKFEFLFKWVRLFYPRSAGVNTIYLVYFFFPQKVLRINGRVPFPVHFTSRVLYHNNIALPEKNNLWLNSGCYIQARNGIKMGHNIRIGPGVGILSINHNVNDYDKWDKAEPITIGDNVWIGMNSVVLPEVTIGDNVIISSNALVSNDVPSDSIAAGNPCRVIRKKPPYEGEDYSNLS